MSAWLSASSHDPRSRRISARWTRQRPWRLPTALVSHHRSIASVHCSATSYWAEALQGAHELAVDDTGRQRIEVTGHGRHPGLVEQRQTLPDVAVQDEQPGFGDPADGRRRGIARRTDVDGLPGPVPGGGQVAGQHPLVGADDAQPRVRRRLALAVEQPVRARQPAPHRRHEGGVEEQVHGHANGCSRGRELVAGPHGRRVGPLPRLDGRRPDGPPRTRPRRARTGRTEPARPSASAAMRRSNACCQSPCAAAERARSTRPAASSLIARLPSRGRWSRASAPTVTVGVTAVTVLLPPLGWGLTSPRTRQSRGGAMKRAQVNGVELEYEVVGSGEPVLLISPVLADGFLPLLSEPALADRYQLIRYHKRGWVGSTHTMPPVSIATHAADAAALLEHLGVPRAHVAGHSTGAVVAAQLALDSPGTVQTLTLLEPLMLSVPSGEAVLQQVGPAFEAYGRGDHEGAWALFLSAATGLDWADVPGRARASGSRARWRRRSRTPTPSSASSCLPSPSGRSVPSRQPPSAARCCPCSAPTPCRCSWRSPTFLRSSVPHVEDVHDRRRRPSPAHPAARARRAGDGRVPGQARLRGRVRTRRGPLFG